MQDLGTGPNARLRRGAPLSSGFMTSSCSVNRVTIVVERRYPVQPGPAPGFSSRGSKKTEGGPKNQKRGHIFKIEYWMYVATGGPNAKWVGPISNGGPGTTGPPAGDGSPFAALTRELNTFANVREEIC